MYAATTYPIILASGSPRRKDLLEQVGLTFSVRSVDIDETPHAHESAPDYVMRMAYEKSVAAQSEFAYLSDKPATIITADTIGQLDGEVLVKPRDKDDAFAIWQRMSGRSHEVITAVCVLRGDARLQAQVTTKVEFVTLTPQMMQAYWETGEPADKAGGYGIQGRGAAWVRRICGSYPNVVGLPLVETLELLDALEQTHAD